jgi:hypothetical protein
MMLLSKNTKTPTDNRRLSVIHTLAKGKPFVTLNLQGEPKIIGKFYELNYGKQRVGPARRLILSASFRCDSIDRLTPRLAENT